MSGRPPDGQRFYSQEHQQYYRYSAREDAYVFENGTRVRPWQSGGSSSVAPAATSSQTSATRAQSNVAAGQSSANVPIPRGTAAEAARRPSTVSQQPLPPRTSSSIQGPSSSTGPQSQSAGGGSAGRASTVPTQSPSQQSNYVRSGTNTGAGSTQPVGQQSSYARPGANTSAGSSQPGSQQSSYGRLGTSTTPAQPLNQQSNYVRTGTNTGAGPAQPVGQQSSYGRAGPTTVSTQPASQQSSYGRPETTMAPAQPANQQSSYGRPGINTITAQPASQQSIYVRSGTSISPAQPASQQSLHGRSGTNTIPAQPASQQSGSVRPGTNTVPAQLASQPSSSMRAATNTTLAQPESQRSTLVPQEDDGITMITATRGGRTTTYGVGRPVRPTTADPPPDRLEWSLQIAGPSRDRFTKAEKDKLDILVNSLQDADIIELYLATPVPRRGLNTSYVTATARGDSQIRTKRKFVVVEKKSTCCYVVPILTYGGRGLANLPAGARKRHHVRVHTGHDPPSYTDEELQPTPLPTGSFDTLRSETLEVRTFDPARKLDPMSRLNLRVVWMIDYTYPFTRFGRLTTTSRQRFEALIRMLGPWPSQLALEEDLERRFRQLRQIARQTQPPLPMLELPPACLTDGQSFSEWAARLNQIWQHERAQRAAAPAAANANDDDDDDTDDDDEEEEEDVATIEADLRRIYALLRQRAAAMNPPRVVPQLSQAHFRDRALFGEWAENLKRLWQQQEAEANRRRRDEGTDQRRGDGDDRRGGGGGGGGGGPADRRGGGGGHAGRGGGTRN